MHTWFDVCPVELRKLELAGLFTPHEFVLRWQRMCEWLEERSASASKADVKWLRSRLAAEGSDKTAASSAAAAATGRPSKKRTRD